MQHDRKIDFCKFTSETNRREFRARKQHEWKIVFSVMTFYILSATVKLKNGIQFPTGWLICTAFVYGLVAVFTIIFLKFTHTANNTNKYIAHNAEQTIQKLLNGNDPGKLDLFNVDSSLFPWKSLYLPAKGGLWDWLCKSVLIGVVAIVSGIILAQ